MIDLPTTIFQGQLHQDCGICTRMIGYQTVQLGNSTSKQKAWELERSLPIISTFEKKNLIFQVHILICIPIRCLMLTHSKAC